MINPFDFDQKQIGFPWTNARTRASIRRWTNFSTIALRNSDRRSSRMEFIRRWRRHRAEDSKTL